MGGTCIPFMVRWPKVVKKGVSNTFVCQMDLLASLAALVGQSYGDKIDSQNTLPAFLGKEGNGRQEMIIEGMFNYAFRQGDYVLLPPYPGSQKSFELYNIKTDPSQKHNLANDKKYRRRTRQMLQRFEALKRETNKVTNF